MRTAKIASLSAEQDEWLRRAHDAAAVAAKDLVGKNGPIRPGATVGALTKHEWAWIVSGALHAWVATRARQASEEGWNEEIAIRTTGLAHDPWLCGAVASTLPTLFASLPDLDWSSPIGSWSKQTITEFLTVAFALCTRAVAARDATEKKIAGAKTYPTGPGPDCPFMWEGR
jgi:hypothetical protein